MGALLREKRQLYNNVGCHTYFSHSRADKRIDIRSLSFSSWRDTVERLYNGHLENRGKRPLYRNGRYEEVGVLYSTCPFLFLQHLFFVKKDAYLSI